MAIIPSNVRQVWANNLDSEFYLISNAIMCGCRSAAIDTEFPGTVFNPLPQQVYAHLPPQDYYSIMKKNVDKLHIIQLGLTLFDGIGNHYVWQFNFRDFDKNIHPHNKDSITFLEKQGIDFSRNRRYGINSSVFADRLKSLVLPYRLTWVTFQGSYDFGLLIKIMTLKNLPDNVGDFMELVSAYFGIHSCDLKLVTYLLGMPGSLDNVGKKLGLSRVTGTSHQAGHDSLFTMQVFTKLRSYYPTKFIGLNHKLYGLTFI